MVKLKYQVYPKNDLTIFKSAIFPEIGLFVRVKIIIFCQIAIPFKYLVREPQNRTTERAVLTDLRLCTYQTLQLCT